MLLFNQFFKKMPFFEINNWRPTWNLISNLMNCAVLWPYSFKCVALFFWQFCFVPHNVVIAPYNMAPNVGRHQNFNILCMAIAILIQSGSTLFWDVFWFLLSFRFSTLGPILILYRYNEVLGAIWFKYRWEECNSAPSDFLCFGNFTHLFRQI